MKLYYSPGACSLSPHIAIEEAGLKADYVKVNLKDKKTEAGDDYTKINPKGQVPYLVFDDGEGLSEGPAIVQYIADQSPNSKIAPANGKKERYRLQEWLNFISTEIHKAFGPLFFPGSTDDAKAMAKERLASKFKYVDEKLAGKDYLMGEDFSVADGYLFTVSRWADAMKIDISALPNFIAYKARVAARPKVREALLAEGLIKA